MKVQSAYYWTHLKRAFAHLFAQDAAALAQLSDIVDAVVAAPRSEQHQPVSDLFNVLGTQPNAMELGFLIGRQMPITAHGDLALAFKIAPTFGDALSLVAKYHRREVPLALYSYTHTATEGRFSIGFRCPIDDKGEALFVSAVVAMIENELSHMAGRGAHLKAVELTASSKGWEPAYRRHASVATSASHCVNTIVFDKAVLDAPNPAADVVTHDRLVSEYEQQAILQDAGISPSAHIRELVMANIGNPPGLDSLAKSLHLTRRQLRLALARDETSYQEVVRSCRVEYASALFRNPALSISQIAYRLGYSDLSAFSRSFTRWTGKSPSRFRTEMPS